MDTGDYQEMVVRLYMAGKTVTEIASALGRTERAIWVQLTNLRCSGVNIPYRRPKQRKGLVGDLNAIIERHKNGIAGGAK